jgi:uncharacterized protein
MTEQAPTLCIHHHPCADGFTSAWAVWKRFPNTKFHPGVHGKPPPDVTGQDVVIVDFSYPEATLLKMAETAASILVLDHHDTARADLANLPPASLAWETHVQEACDPRYIDEPLRSIGVQFDMKRSGAMMAWNYFHPGVPAPNLIQHIQDRDLWKFELDGTREIQSWVFSFPYDFDVWETLALQLASEAGWNEAFTQGEAISRKHLKDIEEIIGGTAREMIIGGHKIQVANMPWTMASDAAGIMAEHAEFAAVYYDADNGERVFSLRSRGNFHVGNLAKEMGRRFGTNGGGHKGAAGFRAPCGWDGE